MKLTEWLDVWMDLPFDVDFKTVKLAITGTYRHVAQWLLINTHHKVLNISPGLIEACKHFLMGFSKYRGLIYALFMLIHYTNKGFFKCTVPHKMCSSKTNCVALMKKTVQFKSLFSGSKV